jgi:hypothetical protein
VITHYPMNRTLSMLVTALVVVAGCHARVAPVPAARVLFFDDFAAGALDRSHWTVRVTGRTVNEEQQAYVDDTATIRVVTGAAAQGAANALMIRARSRPGHLTPEGNRFDFVSGRFDSRGRWSSRMEPLRRACVSPLAMGSGPPSGCSVLDGGPTPARST